MNDRAESRLVTVLVEHYWPGVTAEAFRGAVDRVRMSASQLASAGEAIRYLHGTLVPADEAAFCVFEAASVELVGRAHDNAGVDFERLLIAVEVDDERGTTRTMAIP